ncbi:glycosyltransferase [Helcococcus sueciensis]|uniref:glycosyltransferase n=1 Tax=Helcococcus sueciensis TaxID=241555 RepID=UPI0003F8DC04|nr:glycosyltransferase [Helcococcus sueciensis]
MKIVFFTETYPPFINGVATQTEMLKRTYEKLGHEVLVVTVGSEKQDDIEIIDNVIYIPGILLKKIYNYRLAIPIRSSKINKLIDFDPDIIHVQNEFGIGESGRKYSKKFNIPMIYTLHSEYDRFLFYVGLKYFESFSKKLSDEYFKKFSKTADIVTSPSKKAQNYIDRQKIGKQVVVVNNSVENDLFLPSKEKDEFRKIFREKYGIEDNCKAFIFVGRIGGEKNISELINNWIYTDFPKEKAVLFIAGDGPEKENLIDFINENNFNDRIIFLGKIPNTEIPKYLYAMDYYTTASLSEMHSISMLEAMASGLPALIKLDKPNKYQIIPGVNGYQWDTKEEFKDLFNKIISLSNEEMLQLKESTLNYANENNNFKQASEYIEIYKKAIKLREEKTRKLED